MFAIMLKLLLYSSCLSIISAYDPFKDENKWDDNDWWRNILTTKEPSFQKTTTDESNWGDNDWWRKFLTTKKPSIRITTKGESIWDNNDWWRKYLTTKAPSIQVTTTDENIFDDRDINKEDLTTKDSIIVLPSIPDDIIFDRDFWKKYFTDEPLIEIPTTTDKNILDDIDWWRTKNPIDLDRWDFNKFTPKPPYQDYNFTHNSAIYFAVFFIIFFVLVAIFACLKYAHEESYRSTPYDFLSSAETQLSVTSDQPTFSTISTTVNIERLHNVVDFSNPMPESSNSSSAVDRPPRYDEVVIGDLLGGKQYAEVKPANSDIPPPPYEESHTDRY